MALLQDIWNFIKKNWSGLAVLFFGYEERRVDEAKEATVEAQLDAKLTQDELDVLKKYDGVSSADVVSGFANRKPGGPPRT